MTKTSIEKSERYEFSGCVVDADRRELTMAGEAVTVQPKAFELLLYLIRNRHRAVDKDELQDTLWPRSIVTETALTRCVMKARRAVGDNADQQSVIKTVHGHGYRFIADIASAPEPLPAEAAPEPAARSRQRINFQPLRVAGSAALLFAAIVFAWLYFAPPALSGPVRLAVLPVENATGNPDNDWVSTGLMALMSRMLQDGGIDVVSSRVVSGLAGDAPLPELIATGSEFREKLAKTAAATHVIGARLEESNGLYRLTYTLAGASKRPTRRTMVGPEPTRLIKDVATTVMSLIVNEPPPLEGHSAVSNDEFVNEAYARAMALYHEGRYEDAKGLFELIIEQEPHLFWPRYERALCIRNLRDFEGAERELIALREEVAKPGMEREQAGVENALGVLYWSTLRHDEARVVLEKMVEISVNSDNLMRAATGYQNLGLVEKNVGNVEAALAYMKKSEGIYGDMDIKMLPGSLLNNLSGVLMQMGQFEEAQSYSERAIESLRLTGERRYEANATNRLADIYARQRFYDKAVETAESALAIRQEIGDEFGIGSSMVSIADIANLRGNYTRALQHAMRAYDIANDLDSERLRVPALVRIARAETRLGNPESAAARYAEIDSIARRNNDPHNIFRAQYGMAETKIALQQYDDAFAIGTEILDQARDENRQREETAGLRVQGKVYSATGRHEDAIKVFEESLAIAESIEDAVVMASLHIHLAEEYLAIDDIESAAPHVALAARERPEDADSLKVQALYESKVGNLETAAELMVLARTNAGEGWDERDAALLASYRAAAEAE